MTTEFNLSCAFFVLLVKCYYSLLRLAQHNVLHPGCSTPNDTLVCKIYCGCSSTQTRQATHTSCYCNYSCSSTPKKKPYLYTAIFCSLGYNNIPL